MADEIIQELWQVKDNIASEHHYNLKKLVKYLQEKKRKGNHRIVDLRHDSKITQCTPEKSDEMAKKLKKSDLEPI